MCPLALSAFLLLGGGAQSVNDDFDDGALDGWTSSGLEILVTDGDGEVVLEEDSAVGRAELVQTVNADPAEKCSVAVRVKLGRVEKLYRRACVRIARAKVGFARVTVWSPPSPPPPPSLKTEKLKLECGVVGEAGTRTEVISDWSQTGPEDTELNLEVQGDQLTARFGSRSCTCDTTGLDVGADSTRYVIEAGGNKEVVRLDDFEAQWKEPPPP